MEKLTELLTPQQVAHILHLSTGTLANWRWSGTGPRYVKINGASIRYRRSDVTSWSESNGWQWSR